MLTPAKRGTLTDADIRKLPIPERDVLITAGGPRDGLYLRHRASGKKVWIVRRRVAGAWRVKTLGDWPALTALNARRQASSIELRKASPETFGEAAKTFYAEVIEPRYRSAPQETLAYFTRDCKGLTTRRLDKVTRADLVRIIRAKAAGDDDTPGAPNAAVKLLVLLKQFFRWALVAELLEQDPTAGLTAKVLNLPAYEPRERVLADDEIKALWKMPDEPYGRLLRFALLTACRIGEAIKFDDEQVVGDVWTIPETKNGRPHAVPLAPAAAALATAGWPARKYESLHSYFVAHGYGWRPHDLRRTAATRMRDAGVSVEVIEAVLNHAPPRLVRVYQRPNMVPAMREALGKLQAEVERVTGDS